MECIMTILNMCCSWLTFSSPSSAAAAAAAAASAGDDDDDDDGNIPPRREKYDVFISFRGDDTRRGITSHLKEALEQKKIETYIDDRLRRGEEIGPALLEAIEKSTLSVVIFSQNYASSTWCLDELVHVLKCKEKYGQMIIPVFYDINPSHVRKQEGSYTDAFAQHEKRFKDRLDKVHEWRDALTTAANLSGFDSQTYRTDADLVKHVVKGISTKLCHDSSCNLEGLVGIESRIEQIESLLGIHSQDAYITVGIWGMGGIGKTTLAETVFHTLSSQFEGCCFLRNVREREQKDGIDHLENTLLSEILKEECSSRGSIVVRERLSRTKVLLVLDDVSDLMQMERLVGDRRYGTGSRTIITSRDRGTFGKTVEEGKIYEVEGLKLDDALQLFCSRAFKNNTTPITDYKELAEKAVANAGGVPLALILLGSSFLNCKSKEAWEQKLGKLNEFPNEKLHRVLRQSYDGLERYEKEIFLDIACFHKGRTVKEAKQMLAIRGNHAAAGIEVLIYMSLISVHSTEQSFGSTERREAIGMHDLLQEMGRTIVQKQCFEDPGKRNRLYNDEDVYQVLKRNTETPNVQAVRVGWYNIEKRPLKRADFKLMSDLRLLIVYSFDKFNASLELPDSLRYLEWPRYPLESLPTIFCPENLVELHMPASKVKKLWKEDQILVNLEVIDLLNSESLTEVPNLSGSLKIVEIKLWGCKSLVEIPSYFQHLDKLTHLDLGCCTGLKYLPEMPGNLTYLCLEHIGIEELPESVWSNENISYLNITSCKDLKKLPSSRCKLKNLEKLDLRACSKFENFPEILEPLEPLEHLKSLSLIQTAVTELPSSVCELNYLERIDLTDCRRFSKFPEMLKPMEHLVDLCLHGTAVEMLPSSIGNLNRLQGLNLRYCWQLKDVPTSIYSLTNLKWLSFIGCMRLEKLPSSSVGFLSLETLELSHSGILEIPASIKQASRLSILELFNCKRLQSIPELLVLCNVKAQGCTSLKIVSSSRRALTNYCFRVFTDCPKLDDNSRSNIMDEAQIAIMRMATVAPLKDYWLPYNPWPQINIVCQGKEIPNWFSYQNEGSSVDIELCPDWFRTGLFGFALSVVLSNVCFDDLRVRTNFIVKFMGESHELFSSESIIPRSYDCDGQHHVHVWNEAFRSEEVGKNCSPDVYKLAQEASVVFFCPDSEDFKNSEDSEDSEEQPGSASSVKVESCGICPLYAEDAEKFEVDHVFMSREPKVEETRQDDDSEASGSRDELEASGSSDESEANESDDHGSEASGIEDDSDF